MTFKDREKIRLAEMKRMLFSREACRSGMYRRKRREFCLHEDFSSENIETGIREAALAYFEARGIVWHHGKGDGPSNHLCCSQSCCVNFWFPFIQAPNNLRTVLRGVGYDAVEVLPLNGDQSLPDASRPFVAFEWIGKRNYLGELGRGGEVAADEDRTRGARFTSFDFCVRFRRSDGRVQLVAGEWKYTERYGKESKRFSGTGTDRLDRIYRKHLERPGCQVAGNVPFESLFFDPFDQLMRQQLLCTAMERYGEMEAEIVSLLHVAPRANRELMTHVTSPALEGIGSDIHATWAALVRPERFRGVATEDLLPLARANAPASRSGEYLQLRYGAMA